MALPSDRTERTDKNVQKTVSDAINDTLQTVLDIAAHDVEVAGEQISNQFLKMSNLAKDEVLLVESMVNHFNNIRLGDTTASFDQFCMYLNSTLALAVEKNILASYVVAQSVDGLGELTHKLSCLQQEMEKPNPSPQQQSREIVECLYEIKKIRNALSNIILDNAEKDRWLKDMSVIEGLARSAPERSGNFVSATRKSTELSEKIQSICNQIVMLMQFQDRNSQIISNIKSIVSRYHTLAQLNPTYAACRAEDDMQANILKQDIKMTEIRKIFDHHLENSETPATLSALSSDNHDDNAELF